MKKLLFIFFLLPFFTQAQVIVTVAGTGLGGYDGDGGPATNAKLHYPHALAFDKDGNLYVTDEGAYRVRKINSEVHLLSFLCLYLYLDVCISLINHIKGAAII
jgi:hypothetical protein